jgi:hypothetical protein
MGNLAWRSRRRCPARPINQAQNKFASWFRIEVGVGDTLAIPLETQLLQHPHTQGAHAAYFLRHLGLGPYRVHDGENSIAMLAQKIVPGIQLPFGRLNHFHGQVSQLPGNLPRPHFYRLAVILSGQHDIRVLVDIGQSELAPTLFGQVDVLHQPDHAVYRLIAIGHFGMPASRQRKDESKIA